MRIGTFSYSSECLEKGGGHSRLPMNSLINEGFKTHQHVQVERCFLKYCLHRPPNSHSALDH